MGEGRLKLGKRDFVWAGLIVVLFGVGFGYAYGGSDPVVMGHSSGEIVVDNAFCNRITGHDCGYESDDGFNLSFEYIICDNEALCDSVPASMPDGQFIVGTYCPEGYSVSSCSIGANSNNAALDVIMTVDISESHCSKYIECGIPNECANPKLTLICVK